MEKRNVEITLNKANEWYNSNNPSLKELALQAFTEKELVQPYWKNIKTFEDAIDALGLSNFSKDTLKQQINRINNGVSVVISNMLVAQYKLYFIRKALNGSDWEPELNEGKVYCSLIHWYAKDKNYPSCMTKIEEIRDTCNGKLYNLVSSNVYHEYNSLGNFGCGFSDVNPKLGLLSCKSEEIAIHLVTYFSKIIFDAIYGQYNNYEWV